MRPWAFSQPAGWPLGALFQSRNWGQGTRHGDVGPVRMEKRQDRVTEMTRDIDGLRERLISKKVPKERRSESPASGRRWRERAWN